jgi:hypothetical protein
MRAVICMFVPQNPLCPVFAYGEFYWCKELKCHVWGGQTKKPRVLEMEEFNRIVDRLLDEQDFFGKRTIRLLPDPTSIAPPKVFAPMVRTERDDLAERHDQLVDRSVGAMAIAEGEEGWQQIPLDCPMLASVANLRLLYEQANLPPPVPQIDLPKRGERRRSRRAKVKLT